jgi:hypothetical protein
MDLQALDLRRPAGAVAAAVGPARDDRPVEAEPGGFAEAALETGDGPQLAEQSDLADRHGSGRDGAVAK